MRVYSENYDAFFEMTSRALLRGAQRALDPFDLEAVVRYGRSLYENVALKIFLGDKEARTFASKAATARWRRTSSASPSLPMPIRQRG